VNLYVNEAASPKVQGFELSDVAIFVPKTFSGSRMLDQVLRELVALTMNRLGRVKAVRMRWVDGIPADSKYATVRAILQGGPTECKLAVQNIQAFCQSMAYSFRQEYVLMTVNGTHIRCYPHARSSPVSAANRSDHDNSLA